MKKQLIVVYSLALIGLLHSCSTEKKNKPLKGGVWRGYLTLVDSIGRLLPFNFHLDYRNDSMQLDIMNAEERIRVDEVSFVGDSVLIHMPIFDSEFRCKKSGDTMLTGHWINHARKEKKSIPVTKNL